MRYFILLLLTLISFNVYSADYSDEEQQIRCLAQNIFFESGAESKTGQLAVAFVTMNRTKSGKFPDTVCGVVKQKVKGYCQFSWVCNPTKKIHTVKHTKTYQEILDLAERVYYDYENFHDITHGALYFHSVSIYPGWHNLKKTTRIGNHIFYKPKVKTRKS